MKDFFIMHILLSLYIIKALGIMAVMSKKKLIEQVQNKVNPYVQSTDIPVRLKSEEDGDKEAFYLEITPYIKLFCSASRRKRLAKLTPKAVHLLIWLVQGIPSGTDVIVFNPRRYLEESGISLPTSRSAIRELVDNGILAYTTHQQAYFLNPMVLFKGSRIRKYPSRVIVVSGKRDIRRIEEGLEVNEDGSIIE